MRIILDTNAYSQLKRGHEGVAGLVRHARRILFSAIVAGELIYGFRHGSRTAKNLDELDAFLASPYVDFLPVTRTTADRFGRIAAALRKLGTPLPTNDIWLAAQALETGADLVSFDRHFESIGGVAWVCP